MRALRREYKIRNLNELLNFAKGVPLKKGDTFFVTTDRTVLGNQNLCSVDCKELEGKLKVNDLIILDFGNVRLRVKDKVPISDIEHFKDA